MSIYEATELMARRSLMMLFMQIYQIEIQWNADGTCQIASYLVDGVRSPGGDTSDLYVLNLVEKFVNVKGLTLPWEVGETATSPPAPSPCAAGEGNGS